MQSRKLRQIPIIESEMKESRNYVVRIVNILGGRAGRQKGHKIPPVSEINKDCFAIYS